MIGCRIRIIGVATLILIVFSFSSIAQEEDKQDSADGRDLPQKQDKQEKEEGRWKLSFGTFHYTETGKGPLDVTKTRLNTQAEADFRPSEQILLKFGMEFDRSFYDLDGLSVIIPGARDRAIDELDSYGLKFEALYIDSLSLAYFSMLNLSLNREPGAGTSDSLQTGCVFGLRYAHSQNLGFRFGVAGFTRIEDSPMIMPAIGLEWRPDEKWELLVGFPETGITYKANKMISLFIRGHFEFRDYRLDQSGPLDDAILRDDILGVELGTKWRITPNSMFCLSAGLPLQREFTIDDKRGHAQYNEDLSCRPFFGGSFEVRF